MAIALLSTNDNQTKLQRMEVETNLYKLQKIATLDKSLDFLPMWKAKDQGKLRALVCAIVAWFVEGYKEGSRMRTTDILKFADFVCEYRADSVEDLLLCFKMAENGDLRDPDDFKPIRRYSTMDLELLMRYWRSYLLEKAAIRELRVNEKKYEETGYTRTPEESKVLVAERPAPKEIAEPAQTMKDLLSDISKGIDPFELDRKARLTNPTPRK